MIEISLQKILKSPGGQMKLDVELNLREGSLTTIYGKSGAGKSTLLMLIAGLLKPDTGQIKLGNEVWTDTDKKLMLSPQKRKIGFVFQEYALFPNMTVRENLLFARKKGATASLVDQLIDITDLGELQGMRPNTLSGGQKQRVALARALVSQPKLLLLDEPLSALDQEMRLKLQNYILKVHREFELTTLLISHDVSEIIRLSDFMIELDKGLIVKKGDPVSFFTQDKVNAKFQFTGEVMHLARQDFIVIVTVLIGRDLVKVIANDQEAADLNIGDKVLIASKAFNPIIHKIS